MAPPDLRGSDDDRRVDDALEQQAAYYRARAPEYDEWFLRRGRYDRGAVANAQWFREVDEVREALAAELPARDVLELACGTGLFTERLAAGATHVTAVDASREVVALNRARCAAAGAAGRRVTYEVADVFRWEAARRYDLVFFGFWLSHVPPTRFGAFWRLVDAALAPSGRVFFVDNRRSAPTTASREGPDGLETRTLNDGREFEIVKIFYEAPVLHERLAGLGLAMDVRETERHFVFAAGGRA